LRAEQRRAHLPLASGNALAMNHDRFVVLGVASARAPWFRAVSQWAHAASVPLEFLKCLSPEEVRARLGSGQPLSALRADAGVPEGRERRPRQSLSLKASPPTAAGAVASFWPIFACAPSRRCCTT